MGFSDQPPDLPPDEDDIPTGPYTPPEEPATLIWWLATPMAAKFHGQAVNIDDAGTRRRAAADLGVSTF